MTSEKLPQDADQYLDKGCGRCNLYNTPACKVNAWRQELIELRSIIAEFPFTEEIKWGVPVYTINGKNVVSISALKQYAALSFFKGYLLDDVHTILEKAGDDSRIGRLIRLRSTEEIRKLTPIIRDYLHQSIKLQKKDRQNPPPPPAELSFPEIFIKILEQNDPLNRAFSSLTQGRKRGYSLYFSSAKKTETLITRIEKCIPLILEGKGLHE